MARLAEQARLGNIERQDFEERMRDITSAAILLAFLLAGGNPQSPSGQQRLADMQRTAAERIPRLADDIYAGRYGETEIQTAPEGRDKMLTRLLLWAGSMETAYWLGRNYAPPTQTTDEGATITVTETWRRGNTEKPCSTCVTLDGVTLTIEEWEQLGLYPKHPDLECGGWNCDCQRTDEGLESDGLENILPLLGV